MTLSVQATRGDNHKRLTFAQRERWVPDNDTGAEFVPGHWEAVGEVETIEPGATATWAWGDEDGQSVKIWSEALPIEG